jgi:hypothetical protein
MDEERMTSQRIWFLEDVQYYFMADPQSAGGGAA